ncbi:pilus assembly protein PilP, partial [Halomonas piscis]|uniref:pilus assembly protein PilP n=1 Tax=Halomonas piscis TaxID=3031727 RepID=UPI00289CB683
SSVSICRGMAGLQFVGVGTFILRACPYPANTPAMKRQQALELVGTLRMGKRRSALIKTPQGEVTSVREGSYMGVNFGRVKQIEPQRLTVVERIFKPREGWQERSVSIELAVDEARQ